MSPREEPQAYDRALKSLMGDEVAEILPHLLPEAEFVDEENIEVDSQSHHSAK